MRFLIVEKMKGQGCDYTIGCGTSTTFVEAVSPEEAFKKLCRSNDWDLKGEVCWKWAAPGGEYELEKVMIIPVTETNEHLFPAFIKQKQKEHEKNVISAKEDQERAEYEKLKAKFESN